MGRFAYWMNVSLDLRIEQAPGSLPDFMRAYGETATANPKVVVSCSRRGADHNTRIMGGDDAIEQLATLRANTDGTIGVGGATLATQLLRAGLLDELLEHQSFERGVTMHRYAVLDPRQANPC